MHTRSTHPMQLHVGITGVNLGMVGTQRIVAGSRTEPRSGTSDGRLRFRVVTFYEPSQALLTPPLPFSSPLLPSPYPPVNTTQRNSLTPPGTWTQRFGKLE